METPNLAVTENALFTWQFGRLAGRKEREIPPPQTPFGMTDFRVCCD
jgi:hypothetical protein